MYLLDTNVVSELMRRRPAPAVVLWTDGLRRVYLSVVSVEEITFGLAAKKNERIERWFEWYLATFCEVLPVTKSIAARSGGLRARLKSRGATRTPSDMLIAATAHEHELSLATRNVRDFADCGLRVVNPFDP